MATRTNDINVNHVLIIGGIIILLPVLSGLFSVSQTAADILKAPGRLIDAMNNEIDQFALSNAEKIFLQYVQSHNYDPANANDISVMRILQETNLPNKNFLISEYKRYKSPAELLGMWAGRIGVNAMLQKIADNFW